MKGSLQLAFTLVIVVLIAGCGGAVANDLGGSDAAIDTADASDGSSRGAVRCGTATCASGEVCAVSADGSGQCYVRGSEPLPGKAPFPWPSILLYCDGDDDCAAGTRCVVSHGEVFRAECLPESGTCAAHAGHVCSDDRDCHTCPNPGDPDNRFTCKPLRVAGAPDLHACSL